LTFDYTHLFGRFIGFSANTASISGQHLARLILDLALEGVTGKYFSGLTEVPSSKESYDQQKAMELFWERSAALVGLQSIETLLPLVSSE
jgi:hypothetical protein